MPGSACRRPWLTGAQRGRRRCCMCAARAWTAAGWRARCSSCRRAHTSTPAALQVRVQVYSVSAQVPLIRHLCATCSRFNPAHRAADVKPELPADGVAGRRARGRAARRRLARAAGGRARGARRPARAARPGPARRLRARGCALEAREAPCQSQRPCALPAAGQQVGAQAQTRRTPCGAALCLQGSPSLTSGGTTPAKA